MIENQRAYQLIHSKTNSRLLAKGVALLLKGIGIVFASLYGLLCKRQIPKQAIEEIREHAEALCKKPDCEYEVRPLPAQDSRVDVSVIVPMYNAQRYIRECVESILHQKTMYSYELILVNDHSTDDTMQIVAQYQEHPHIKWVQPELGGSAARTRNAGLSCATGRYLLFVDSDDVLAPDAIEELVGAMEYTSADVVQGGWQYLYEDGSMGARQCYPDAIYVEQKAKQRLELPGMPWGKLYKRELFDMIRFPSGYTCFEDTIIHFLVFRKAEVVASIGSNVYYWRKNQQGITATSQSSARAVQSYWIVEEMNAVNDRLSLPRDELYTMCMIGQLSNFCYANVKEMDEVVQKELFLLCCDLYEKTLLHRKDWHLPYALSMGERALRGRYFNLWKLQGKLYQLIR